MSDGKLSDTFMREVIQSVLENQVGMLDDDAAMAAEWIVDAIRYEEDKLC